MQMIVSESQRNDYGYHTTLSARLNKKTKDIGMTAMNETKVS